MTTITINFICNFIFALIDVLLINYYLDYTYTRKCKNCYFVLIPCTIALAILNMYFSKLRIENIIGTIIILFLLISIYKINQRDSIIITLIVFLTLLSIKTSVQFIFEFIFEIHLKINTNELIPPIKISYLIICKYCEYFIVNCLIKQKNRNNIFKIHYFKIISSLISIVFATTIIFSADYFIPIHQLRKILIATVVIYNIALVLFDRYQVKHDNIEKNYALAKQRLEMAIDYDKERLENDRATREIRHNLKNQLIVISSYIRHDEIDKALNYIKEITHEVEETSSTTHTGNYTIDVLLNSKINDAKALGIEVKERYGIIDFGDINLEHLGKLLGCALDNAIEAASQVKDNKFISIHLSSNTGHLAILISNSTIVDGDIHFHKTSKIMHKKDHGFGVKAIYDVANLYDGSVFYEKTGHVVKLKIIMSLQAPSR